MTATVLARLAALKTLPMPDLKKQWRDLFDTEPPPFNRRFLESRLAYRIQELAYGGLKPETIARLEALAEDLESDQPRQRRRSVGRPVAGTQRERILRDQRAHGRTSEEAQQRADHASFYASTFFVPPIARWTRLLNDVHSGVANELNKALSGLENANHQALSGVLGHINFAKKVGESEIPDERLRRLISHFNRYRLLDEDFEFPDLLGAAYEYLISEFADSAGKKAGEFYTPRGVVQLMVRILDLNRPGFAGGRLV